MADIQPLDNKISDDDELANVLAGVKNEAAAIDAASTTATSTDSVTSLPPVPPATPDPTLDFEQTPAVDTAAPAAAPASAPTLADLSAASAAAATPSSAITTPVAASPELESLKKETLGELRPLVGKLDLPADEKFDTLLLIIRSTDDQSLLGPAHEAAKSIPDEARRASALLDIIKEIDYFSTKS